MTNEELARAIQGGDKDKLLELWAAMRIFIGMWGIFPMRRIC